jgi:glycosyltransferase involved in cell wall biosynthesis
MPLYRTLVRQCDLLVYVCEAQAAYWRARRWRAAREAVIHNGVDASRFALAPPPSARGEALALRQRHGLEACDVVVGLCAVMRPEKAHRDLLQALACLAPRHPRLHALLIGDGPERAGIEREVQRLGLEGRVRITGLLDDVRPALAACDVLAITSRAVETFSMAALEAMALGRALVMSEVGGAREQVVPGLTGWLYPAGDVQALSACLDVAVTDLANTHRMGQAAARLVRERFTEPSMVASYASALGQLAAARRRTRGDTPASWPGPHGPS